MKLSPPPNIIDWFFITFFVSAMIITVVLTVVENTN